MITRWKRLFITVISVVLFVGSSFAVTHYGKKPPPPYDLEFLTKKLDLMNRNSKVRADTALHNLEVYEKIYNRNLAILKRVEKFNQRSDIQERILKETYELYHKTKKAMIMDGMRLPPYSTVWYQSQLDYFKNEVPREI